MYQLFYNGVSPEQAVSDAERQEVTDTYYSGSDPEVDLIKITAEQADAVLTRWTGLTLAETDALNMGSFSYLSDYDAYYHFHGDTNAPRLRLLLCRRAQRRYRDPLLPAGAVRRVSGRHRRFRGRGLGKGYGGTAVRRRAPHPLQPDLRQAG